MTLKKSSPNGLKNVTNGKRAVYVSEVHPDIPFIIHPDSVLYEYDQAPQRVIFLESAYEPGTDENDARVSMRICCPVA